MKVINGKKFYKREIDAAVRVDGDGWDRNNGRNTQCYSLWYEPKSGYVRLDADNSGDCYGDYSTKEYASLEEFFAASAKSNADVGELLGTIDEDDPVRVEVADRWAAFCEGQRRGKKRASPECTPNIRAILHQEAQNYTERAAYISDLALSSMWGDAEDAAIPQDRIEMLGNIYDAVNCTLNDLLARYDLSQSDFARYFGIPIRTVQNWCGGLRTCPRYILTMAYEILQHNNK